MKVAIASGKGGTGKTTVSTNLASLLARRDSVVLVDLDVEEPNSGLFLGGTLLHQEPCHKWTPRWSPGNCSLCGYCQEVCNFNAVTVVRDRVMVFPELCHGCYACSELCPTSSLPMVPAPLGELSHRAVGDLDFVESRLRIGEEGSSGLIRQTIDYVDEHFPGVSYQIYDAPPGTTCPVLEATRDVDLVLLVTEPTPFGLHDLKLAVETMRKLERPHGVILNRHGIGDDRVEAFCREQDIPLVARIPNSRRIAEAYAAGELLYEHVPEVAPPLEAITSYLERFREGRQP